MREGSSLIISYYSVIISYYSVIINYYYCWLWSQCQA